MQAKIESLEQAVDEFLNSEHSIDDCAAIWGLLADEVQNGDQDVALEQACRVTRLTSAATLGNHCPTALTVLSFVNMFRPVLTECGLIRREEI